MPVQKKRGMPAFEPTDRDRATVEKLVGYGLEHRQICEFVINERTKKPITPKTLRKVFRAELDRGVVKASITVQDTLFQHIVGAPAVYDEKGQKLREEIKPVYQAAMFWLKCRMGWKDTSIQEIDTKGPIPIVITKNESNY